MELDQLRTLRAAVEHGSLDAAARALHVTPSAASQRLRALESAAGQVLLVRSRPVRATPAGQVLVRLARQVDLLVEDAGQALAPDDPGGPPPVLPVAVNSDSLATWVLPVLSGVADQVQVRVFREDESRTSALLRDGTVTAAVTTQAAAVPGCRSTRLGAMRYRPTASPEFVARWFPDGPTARALAAAPVVRFDDADDLQHAYLRRRSRRATPPMHRIPSSTGFVAAIAHGMGWGMVPDLQAQAPDLAGRLVAFDPAATADVVLHWQRWALRSPSLDLLTGAMTAAARTMLRQRSRGGS